MACDLQFTIGSTMKTKGKTKIYLIEPHELHYPKERFLIGFAGSATDIIDIVDFLERPEVYKKCPTPRGISGLILTESGNIYQFDNPGKWLVVNEKFATMGSGATAALGAMHTGASPLEAVKAASKIDVFTGMGTKVLSFK